MKEMKTLTFPNGETYEIVDAQARQSLETLDADIADAVAEYLAENPIPGGGTADPGDVNLTGYATEKWVTENYQAKGEYLTSVPAGYATETFVQNKISELQQPTNLELLWENPKPATAFVAQKITVDLSNYTWLVVEYRFSTTYDNRNTVFVPVTTGTSQNLNVAGKSNNRTGARTFDISSTGLTMGTAKYDATENDDYAIPTRVYGVITLGNTGMTDLVNAVLAALPTWEGGNY